MTTRNTLILIVLLSLIWILAGFGLQGQLIQPLATHWNASGQPNGYGSAFTALYLLPLMILVLSPLILGLTYIDPFKRNVDTFRPAVNAFVLVFALYLSYIHALTLAWNLGYRFNFNQMLSPAMGIFIFYAGVLIGKARRNWFIGIRTPWTLSSDLVWDKTHRLGSALLKVAGIIALLGIVFPTAAIWLLTVPLLAAALGSVVYSFIEYQKIAAG